MPAPRNSPTLNPVDAHSRPPDLADIVVPQRRKPAPRKPRRRLGRWFAGLIIWAALLLVFVSALFVGRHALWNPDSSAFMRQTQARLAPAEILRQQWVSYDLIADSLKLAVIAAEDQRFPEHAGVDLAAIRRALLEAQRDGQLRGASTISQQTVKNLYLSPSRSVLRKGLEAWLTVVAELLWSKQRILELYLNFAQFGPDIFGAEEAAQVYFAKPAARLSEAESAWLAVLLPAPGRYQIQPPTEFARERPAGIRQQMQRLGPQTLARIDTAQR